MVVQVKKLNSTQIGPRLMQCPVCRKMTARVSSVIGSAGKRRQKLVCYSSSCHSERYV